MIKFGIYCIRNIVNNKIYVGQTGDRRGFPGRWSVERRNLRRNNNKPNRYLQNAWNKYGENNFKFEILESFKVRDKKLLMNREHYWIMKFNSNNNKFGYNIRAASETNLGIKRGSPSDETKKKISEGLKKYFKNNPVKKNANRGKVWDKAEEIRRKYIPHHYTRKKLAKEYNTSIGTIGSIIGEK